MGYNVNCRHFSHWKCKIKTTKFLWFTVQSNCVKSPIKDVECAEQLEHKKPTHFPPAPPKPKCSCNTAICGNCYRKFNQR